MIITEEKTVQKTFLDSKTFSFYTKPTRRPERGLCLSCVHRDTCSLTAIQPVVECEEFYSEEEVKKVADNPGSSPAVSDTSRIEENTYQGLCVNCENRRSCPLSATAGGIWFCEEYC